MSHVTKVEMQIKDLATLEAACTDLGLEFVHGQTHFKTYGGELNRGRCLHAIRVPGNSEAYEIGVAHADSNPGYQLLWDSYAGGKGMVEKVGGREMAALKGRYSENLVQRHYQKRGFRMTRTEDQEFVYVRARK